MAQDFVSPIQSGQELMRFVALVRSLEREKKRRKKSIDGK
jgi:hypothetical protein